MATCVRILVFQTFLASWLSFQLWILVACTALHAIFWQQTQLSLFWAAKGRAAESVQWKQVVLCAQLKLEIQSLVMIWIWCAWWQHGCLRKSKMQNRSWSTEWIDGTAHGGDDDFMPKDETNLTATSTARATVQARKEEDGIWGICVEICPNATWSTSNDNVCCSKEASIG